MSNRVIRQELQWPRVLLRDRTLRLLWFGMTLSTIGDFVTWTALTWFVAQKTNDGAAVGGMLLIWALPAAVTSPILGRLMDRVNIKPLFVFDNVFRGLLMAVLPIWNSIGDIPVWALYAVGALCGALAPVTRVGTGLIIPRATLQRRLPYINTGFAVTEQIAGILGPLVSALAISRMGPINALWFDTVSFMSLALILCMLPVRFCLPITDTGGKDRNQQPAKTPKKIRMHPAVVSVTILSGLFWFSYGPTEAALPLYVPRQLAGGITELSYLFMAVSIGALIGGLLTPRLASLRRTGIILTSIMLGWGVLQVVFAHQHDFKIAFLIWFVAGIVWGPYFALQATFIQRRTPADQLGSVIGIQSGILSPLMPLGAAAGGAIMRVISPEQVVLLSGWMCVVGAATIFIPPWLRERDPENTFGEVGN